MTIARIAFVHNSHPNFPTVGGYLRRGFDQLGYETEHFETGNEVEGFDHYIYVDDSPCNYMEPKFRPATYWAIDMVIPQLWFLQSAEQYFERMKNFDYAAVTSIAALTYCNKKGLPVKLVTFGADLEYHRPYPEIERDLDWVAVWHNCGDRIEACNRAAEKFPNSWVTWRGDFLYAQTISRGKCALNWLRGNLINMRVYEVMAIGVPLITTRNPDMKAFGFVEDEHYLGYEGIEEMLEKITWVQKNQEKANKMAEKARSFVVANHTYKNRAMEILGDHYAS